MFLNKGDWILGRHRAKKKYTHHGLFPGTCVGEDADFLGREQVFHPQGDRHRGHEVRAAAGGPLADGDQRIVIQIEDARFGIAEFLRCDRIPGRTRRLIVGDMPAVAHPTVGGIHPTDFFDRLADPVNGIYRRKMALVFGHGQVGVDWAVKAAPHPALITERMLQRERAALPIQTVIHVEDVQVFQVDPLLVDDLAEVAVLPGGPARQDPAGRPAGQVVLDHFIGHLAGDEAVHVLRFFQLS